MYEESDDAEDGPITRVRIRAVVGFEGNTPFQGFSTWSNHSPYSQAEQETDKTFAGWATEELDATVFIENNQPPQRLGEFRVGMRESHGIGTPYPFIDAFGQRSTVANGRDFLGWLTPTLHFPLPQPVSLRLVRYRRDTPEGRIDGLFLTTYEGLRDAIGKQANFGKQFGMQSDLVVTLEPRDFLTLTDDQSVVAVVECDKDTSGTICGLNPLTHLV
jgi:hypothetical protein